MTVDPSHRFEGPEGAPVLVLSNSLGTDTSLWDLQAEVLARRFRLLRYDLRGHGGSPVPAEGYEIADLGRDVLGLLDRHGIGRAHFAGISIGGMTGMWLGIEAPERIDRLALCFTSAHMPPAGQWAERAAAVRAGGPEAIADAGLERWFSDRMRATSPDVVAHMRDAMVSIPAEGYALATEAIARHDLRERVGSIAAPTLVIGGGDDPSATPGMYGLLAERIPGAELLEIEGARHLGNLEQPQRVTAALVDHFTDD